MEVSGWSQETSMTLTALLSPAAALEGAALQLPGGDCPCRRHSSVLTRVCIPLPRLPAQAAEDSD